MKKFITFTLVGTLALLMLVGCGSNTENNNPDNQTITDNVNPSDTPTPSPTDEPTTTPTPSPTETPTPTPTETPTPTPEPHTHSYSESITKAATCVDAGEKTFTCECGDTYTEQIEVTGHNYEAVADSEVSATCTNDGKEADTKCSLCDDVITGAVIPATGHNYESVTGSEAAPTCEADGKKADEVCTLCGDTINGEAISATGHSYGNYVYNNDAAVGKDGTETAKCSTCGKTKTRTKEGTALTPNYVGYDEFGNGYTLDGKGDKVFYVKCPYSINQPVWVSDQEVYYYGIVGQAQLQSSLCREMAEKNGIPWDNRIKTDIVRLGYYNGQMVVYSHIYIG